MSGELQIVFIYDTLCCRREEDDPKDAILYFHPPEYSEERRIAICGQLMGITHFFSDFFSTPSILSLDSGKFALRRFGKRYILTLGCSSATPDWLLEKQANILFALTKFFHRDIENILAQSNGERASLITRLSSMMEHYLPVSQHHGDLFALTFGILPVLALPKTANSINYDTSVLLQSCMRNPEVLGGAVMYQNKVVGADIPQELAQKLAFIQPYQYPPAEVISLGFKPPLGVHLFVVYLSCSELIRAKRNAAKYDGGELLKFTMPEFLSDDACRSDTGNEADPSDVSSSIGFSDASSYSCQLDDVSQQTGLTVSSESENSQCLSTHGKESRVESGIDSLTRDGEDFLGTSDAAKVNGIVVRKVLRRSKSVEVFSLQPIERDPSLLLASSLPDPRVMHLLYAQMFGSSVGDSSDCTPDELHETDYESDRTSEVKSSQDGESDSTKCGRTKAEPSISTEALETNSAYNSAAPTRNAESSPDAQYPESMSSSRNIEEIGDQKNNLTKSSIRENTIGNQNFSSRNLKTSTASDELRKASLYIHNVGCMRLLLLLESTDTVSSSLLDSLWSAGKNILPELEKSILNADDDTPDLEVGTDPYCYLRYEPIWKSLAHGGKNQSMDFEIVQLMHQDFDTQPHLSELIIRSDDHVVYGYQCIGSEVYYQQSANTLSGLPTPSDLMGKVSVKAKRRLERDHNIILF